MDVSLLDLLSCGLAVVVILLVVSLNTGEGQLDESERTTLVELTAYGFVEMDDSIKLKWKSLDTILSTIPMEGSLDESVRKLQIPQRLDTLLGIGSTLFTKYQEYSFGRSNKIGLKTEFSFPQKARTASLDIRFDLDDYYRASRPDLDYFLGIKVVNKKNTVKDRFTEKFTKPIRVEVKYTTVTQIRIFDLRSDKQLFSFTVSGK